MFHQYNHFSNYHCYNIIITTITYFYPAKPFYIYNYIIIALEFNIMIITSILFTNLLKHYSIYEILCNIDHGGE